MGIGDILTIALVLLILLWALKDDDDDDSGHWQRVKAIAA